MSNRTGSLSVPFGRHQTARSVGLVSGEQRGRSLMSIICTNLVLYWPQGMQQTMVGQQCVALTLDSNTHAGWGRGRTGAGRRALPPAGRERGAFEAGDKRPVVAVYCAYGL